MKNISLRILKIMVIFFISLNFFSCSTSAEACKVKSFSTENVLYDEIQFGSFAYNPTFTGRINLVYQNNKIIKIVGGLFYNQIGFGNLNCYMTNEVETNITYNENDVRVITPNFSDKKFIIIDGQLVSQHISYIPYFDYQDFVNPSQGLHTYEYNGNEITEIKNGLVRRIFYLENGNLVKVDWFLRNSSLGDIIGKYEYLFSGYDSNPNLLKGKFYIEGNFFKAFSNNNYKRYDRHTYNYINGAYIIDESDSAYLFYGALPVDMFTEDCQ